MPTEYASRLDRRRPKPQRARSPCSPVRTRTMSSRDDTNTLPSPWSFLRVTPQRTVSDIAVSHRVIRASETGLPTVERQVQCEHIHPRLSEEAELPSLGVLFDERPDVGRAHLACLRDPVDLVESRRRADVRI